MIVQIASLGCVFATYLLFGCVISSSCANRACCCDILDRDRNTFGLSFVLLTSSLVVAPPIDRTAMRSDCTVSCFERRFLSVLNGTALGMIHESTSYNDAHLNGIVLVLSSIVYVSGVEGGSDQEVDVLLRWRWLAGLVAGLCCCSCSGRRADWARRKAVMVVVVGGGSQES